jgi:hypothetical protein
MDQSAKNLCARLALGTALLLPVWGGVGCGETVIDSAKIEAQAKSNLEKTLPKTLSAGKRGEEFADELGIKAGEGVSSVDCPTPEVDPGATFSCTVTFANGRHASESFKIINKDADVEVLGLKPSK